MNVLGTRVEAFAADVPRAILISDLHLPPDGGALVDALAAAVHAARTARAALFVLGDLFEAYVCRAMVRSGVVREVADRFAVATAAGTPITLLHGNRDFLLGPEFERASGARVVAGGLCGPIGGVPTLLLHGDELCQNDLPYQRAKRWLRRPWLRALLRSLPLAVGERLAGKARRQSQMVVQSGDPNRFLPTTAAIDAAFAGGPSRLVFGHIHRFSHGLHGASAAPREYWVLPAFDATAVGLQITAAGVQPLLFAPGAAPRPVPVPDACPFAAPAAAAS